VDYAVESIQSIIVLTENIDCLKFDILLPLLNWVGMLLDNNLKYIVNTNLIIKLLRKNALPKETAEELLAAVLEIIEKSLNMENPNDQNLKMGNDTIFKYYVCIFY
jgi:hypothetical protein